jgi:hypothetical protein
MIELQHKARNEDWKKVKSRKYPLGTWVTWKDKHWTRSKQLHDAKVQKRYFGVVLYRYNTYNKGWLNPATAILCTDGKIRTTQATLERIERWQVRV